MKPVEIDGSQGEGGGQMLRTSLTLSMLTGTPIVLHRLRAGRKRPGLLRQHLTAVRAATAISGAEVEGDRLGSRRLEFRPRTVLPGSHRFSVGTAGSATLVLQTILPVLLTAEGPSTLVLEGGTHNPKAPPFPFLAEAFLPLVERMGPQVEATLERSGFYPAGGGRFRVEITPTERLSGFELHERGALRKRRATAVLAHLPRHIAERELHLVRRKLNWSATETEIEEADSPGPGNALFLHLGFAQATEVVSGFGAPGVPAETVARGVVREARRFLAAEVPVGEHLADQLLLLLAIAGEGAFTTVPLSSHTTTQLDLIRRFLERNFTVEVLDPRRTRVAVHSTVR